MKKLLLIITIAISSLSFGQITLEHTYITEGFNNFPKTYAFHTDNGLYYYTINELENKVLIYNSSHVLYKTVNLTLDSGYTINTIYLATDKLFNSNTNIEFIVVSGNGTPNSSKMTLFDENGTNLFEFGNRWEANCIKNSDTSYKLIVSTDKSSPNNYDIYSLSGTLSVLQQQAFDKNQFFGYPNPTSNKITIMNPSKGGGNWKLEIFDITGKKVMEKNVLGNETEINLDVTNFENGVYIYKLNGKTNRFIKN